MHIMEGFLPAKHAIVWSVASAPSEGLLTVVVFNALKRFDAGKLQEMKVLSGQGVQA